MGHRDHNQRQRQNQGFPVLGQSSSHGSSLSLLRVPPEILKPPLPYLHVKDEIVSEDPNVSGQGSLRLQEMHVEWSFNKQTQWREIILWAVGEVGSVVVDPENLLVDPHVRGKMLYLLWVWERFSPGTVARQPLLIWDM